MSATLSAMRFLAVKPKVFLQPVTDREGVVEADMLPTTQRTETGTLPVSAFQLTVGLNKNGGRAF